MGLCPSPKNKIHNLLETVLGGTSVATAQWGAIVSLASLSPTCSKQSLYNEHE
jgi:hypothetical protein